MANLQSTTISGGLSHKEGTATVSGTSISIDLTTGRSFEVDLANVSGHPATFNITGAASSSYVTTFIMNVKQGPGNNRQILWGSLSGVNPLWAGDGGSAGSGTSILTGANKHHIYSFSSWDGGTTWYGRIIGQTY